MADPAEYNRGYVDGWLAGQQALMQNVAEQRYKSGQITEAELKEQLERIIEMTKEKP